MNEIQFMSKNSDFFDKHWNNSMYPNIATSKKEVAEFFLQPIFQKINPGNSISILDIGCGDGVHAEIIGEKRSQISSLSYVGIDISSVALKKIMERNCIHSNLIQADAIKLPFSNASFNCVFSYGSIAYTQDPREAFKEMVRVVKPGGLIGLWIYPEKNGISGLLFSLIRNICKLGPKGITRIIADLMVPFLCIIPSYSKISLKNASWNQCREVILVNIEPDQIFFPKPELITNWFNEEHIEIVLNNKNTPITIWGNILSGKQQ